MHRGIIGLATGGRNPEKKKPGRRIRKLTVDPKVALQRRIAAQREEERRAALMKRQEAARARAAEGGKSRTSIRKGSVAERGGRSGAKLISESIERVEAGPGMSSLPAKRVLTPTEKLLEELEALKTAKPEILEEVDITPKVDQPGKKTLAQKEKLREGKGSQQVASSDRTPRGGRVVKTDYGPGQPAARAMTTADRLEARKAAFQANPKELERLQEALRVLDNAETSEARKAAEAEIDKIVKKVTGKGDYGRWVDPSGHFYSDIDDETRRRTGVIKARTAGETEVDALEKGIKKQLQSADDDTRRVILDGLEETFIPVMRENAEKIAKSGGSVRSGHIMPEYIFNDNADLSIKKKLNDWFKFLRNNTGRGPIRPSVVHETISNIIEKHGIKIATGLLATGALATGVAPLAAAGVAITGGILDNLMSPELMGLGEIPEPEDLTNKQKMQYYENLMAPDLGMMSPDLDFEKLFDDKPAPGTPILDILGIR